MKVFVVIGRYCIDYEGCQTAVIAVFSNVQSAKKLVDERDLNAKNDMELQLYNEVRYEVLEMEVLE